MCCDTDNDGPLRFTVAGRSGFLLEALQPALRIDGEAQRFDYSPRQKVSLVMRVEPWGAWDLVACFRYSEDRAAEDPQISRFVLPFARLNLPESATRWGDESWLCSRIRG